MTPTPEQIAAALTTLRDAGMVVNRGWVLRYDEKFGHKWCALSDNVSLEDRARGLFERRKANAMYRNVRLLECVVVEIPAEART